MKRIIDSMSADQIITGWDYSQKDVAEYIESICKPAPTWEDDADGESDMSLLYKDSKDVTVKVFTNFKEGNLILEFEADCGKFGTDEALDSYTLTPAKLLDILQESAYLEHEMEKEMQQEMEQEMEQRQVTREMAQDAQDLSLEGTYI